MSSNQCDLKWKLDHSSFHKQCLRIPKVPKVNCYFHFIMISLLNLSTGSITTEAYERVHQNLGVSKVCLTSHYILLTKANRILILAILKAILKYGATWWQLHCYKPARLSVHHVHNSERLILLQEKCHTEEKQCLIYCSSPTVTKMPQHFWPTFKSYQKICHDFSSVSLNRNIKRKKEKIKKKSRLNNRLKITRKKD